MCSLACCNAFVNSYFTPGTRRAKAPKEGVTAWLKTVKRHCNAPGCGQVPVLAAPRCVWVAALLSKQNALQVGEGAL
jgi:hypothetical protein